MNILKLTFFGIVFFLLNTIKSQVSVNVNIGSPPLWGPVGYAETRYYYLPDVEAYYDVQTSMFIYYGGGVWLHRAFLPDIYSNYDLYGGYKVVINNYYGNDPYVHFHDHKIKYKKGYHSGHQKTIGQRPDNGKSHQKRMPSDQPKREQKQGGNEPNRQKQGNSQPSRVQKQGGNQPAKQLRQGSNQMKQGNKQNGSPGNIKVGSPGGGGGKGKNK